MSETGSDSHSAAVSPQLFEPRNMIVLFVAKLYLDFQNKVVCDRLNNFLLEMKLG